eukprot:764998-Hanusia_phi.AAC.4
MAPGRRHAHEVAGAGLLQVDLAEILEGQVPSTAAYLPSTSHLDHDSILLVCADADKRLAALPPRGLQGRGEGAAGGRARVTKCPVLPFTLMCSRRKRSKSATSSTCMPLRVKPCTTRSPCRPRDASNQRTISPARRSKHGQSLTSAATSYHRLVRRLELGMIIIHFAL